MSHVITNGSNCKYLHKLNIFIKDVVRLYGTSW